MMAPKGCTLFLLNNQVSDRGRADIENFVPDYTLAGVAGVRGKIYFTYAIGGRQSHLATRQCVTEMWPVIMAFMADTWRKSAT